MQRRASEGEPVGVQGMAPLRLDSALTNMTDLEGTPGPVINIQTNFNKSYQELHKYRNTRSKKMQVKQQRQYAINQVRGASLSAVLDIDKTNVASPLTNALSSSTKPTTALPLDQQTGKSLFSHSREGTSFKQQVPISRVREILAGSGKLSTNSNHYDRSSAPYFREASSHIGKQVRNLNTSATDTGVNLQSKKKEKSKQYADLQIVTNSPKSTD